MAYERQTWANGPEGGTPLNATRLNHMEEGIEMASEVSEVTVGVDLAFPPARRQLLLHDHAGTGFPSWVALMNGGAPAGVVSFTGQGLELISPNVATNAPNGQMFGASALNRLTRPAGVGEVDGLSKVYIEWEWCARVFRTANSVFNFSKGFEFGIDTADYGIAGPQPVNANRTLAMTRCVIFDESAAAYFGGKWQITHGDAAVPSMVNITDLDGNLASPTVAGYEGLAVAMNYGKWVRQYTEQVFDLTGGGVVGATSAVLEGLRHNGVGFGSLAIGPTGYDPDVTTNTRANELKTTDLLPAQSVDAGFQGGLNIYCQIANRSNQLSKAKLMINRVRVVAF